MPTSAQLNGYLDNMGGASSCDVWFVWDTTYHSSWQDYTYSTSSQTMYSTGSFSDIISGLNPDIEYHFRAVASNSAGLSQGEDLIIINQIKITTMTDNWNFVSVPCNISVDLTDLIVKYNDINYSWVDAIDPANGPIIDPNVYGWDRVNDMYIPIMSLVPGYGFWMYSYYDCEIWVQGITVVSDEFITDLVTTWNIVGVPYTDSVNLTDLVVNYLGGDYTWAEATDPINGPIVDPNVYGWDRINGMYVPAGDTLDPGYAYWLYAYEDCVLKRTI